MRRRRGIYFMQSKCYSLSECTVNFYVKRYIFVELIVKDVCE